MQPPRARPGSDQAEPPAWSEPARITDGRPAVEPSRGPLLTPAGRAAAQNRRRNGWAATPRARGAGGSDPADRKKRIPNSLRTILRLRPGARHVQDLARARL